MGFSKVGTSFLLVSDASYHISFRDGGGYRSVSSVMRPQFVFCFCGTGDWTQGRSTSELYPQSYFLFFILKQGLTELQRASLSSWGWPQTCNPPVTASQVLGLQTCATTPGLFIYLFIYLFSGTRDWTQGHSTSELHPRPYFLFFILKQGLTKLRRA